MKTIKPKIQKKNTKKAVKKQIEHTLTEKFFAVVGDLGHNAEIIAADIAKASKSIAKKLARDFKEAKQAVTDKIEEVKANNKPAKETPKKSAIKGVKKIKKVVKKAIATAKPAVSSVKVKPIKTEKKVEKVLNKAVSPAKPAAASKKANGDVKATATPKAASPKARSNAKTTASKPIAKPAVKKDTTK